MSDPTAPPWRACPTEAATHPAKKVRTTIELEQIENGITANTTENSTTPSATESATQKQEARQALLNQLKARMLVLRDQVPQSEWVFDCNDASIDANAMKRVRLCLQNRSGVAVVLNAVSRADINSIKKSIGECLVEMYGVDNDWTPTVCAAVRNGDLYAANPMRNSKNGFGNSSFAYVYKQYTAPNLTPSAEIGGERVLFSHLPIHHKVLMRLMCEGAPRRTAILLALSSTPERTMMSWDSVKVAGGRKTKTMTAQERTIEHIDEYGAKYGDRTRRIQVNINDDQDSAKLCFVPFTRDTEVRHLICALLEKPDFFAQHGFKRIAGDKATDLIQVLDEFAVAPPPLAMVLWASGIVHYEASTKPPTRQGDVLPCFSSRTLRASDRRLRFVVGTHTPTLSEPVLQRLAVACARGVVPDYNRNANRDCAPNVYENIMNGKTTQFLRAREISDNERATIEHAISEEGATEEFNALSPLYKHLYGVSQPFADLGFSEADAALLQPTSATTNVTITESM